MFFDMDCKMRDMQPRHKEDCYWFSEWHDMGATISQCAKAPIGVCPCNDGCKFYISRDNVQKMVEEYQSDKR